jgi:hypothetical protein
MPIATDRAIICQWCASHTDATVARIECIDTVVSCPKFVGSSPETEYKKIKSDDRIYHKRATCGAKEMADMSHKRCNYILAE